MRFLTVIWDLDGTLLNTIGDLTDAVNYALSQKEHPARTEEEVRGFVGNGIRRLMERALPAGFTEQIESCLADFRAYYRAHMTDRTVPYEGIPALLDALLARGCTLAVLSNKYDAAAQALTAHFFPGQFAATIGEQPNVPRKPDPASALKLLDLLGAARETTLYVGDSSVDMQTARAAGLFAAGAVWGFQTRQELLQGGADILIDRPAELLRLWES